MLLLEFRSTCSARATTFCCCIVQRLWESQCRPSPLGLYRFARLVERDFDAKGHASVVSNRAELAAEPTTRFRINWTSKMVAGRALSVILVQICVQKVVKPAAAWL